MRVFVNKRGERNMWISKDRDDIVLPFLCAMTYHKTLGRFRHVRKWTFGLSNRIGPVAQVKLLDFETCPSSNQTNRK